MTATSSIGILILVHLGIFRSTSSTGSTGSTGSLKIHGLLYGKQQVPRRRAARGANRTCANPAYTNKILSFAVMANFQVLTSLIDLTLFIRTY